MNKEILTKMIDHTLLKPDASEQDIKKLCEEARDNRFWSVCINSSWVSYAASVLKGTDVKICAVAGFPLGASISGAKANEAKLAIENGASEIDMVINIGFLKSGKIKEFENDIAAVREVCKDKLLKVIIETCLLTNEEKIIACEIAKKEKADFVKTSTGFSTGGATAEDIKLMRKTVGQSMGVKASGGVRSFEDAKNFYEAGANRFGTSSGVAIINGFVGSNAY